MTTQTETKIGHSKADSVGKSKKPEAKKEATKKPEQKAKTEEPTPATEAPAPETKAPEAPAPSPEVNTAVLAPGAFAPKPASQKKGKKNQKDFVHAHVGEDRLKQIQKLQDTTGYSRTELIQQAWDNFVMREDVKAHL